MARQSQELYLNGLLRLQLPETRSGLRATVFHDKRDLRVQSASPSTGKMVISALEPAACSSAVPICWELNFTSATHNSGETSATRKYPRELIEVFKNVPM
jgi:hypothetical protein